MRRAVLLERGRGLEKTNSVHESETDGAIFYPPQERVIVFFWPSSKQSPPFIRPSLLVLLSFSSSEYQD